MSDAISKAIQALTTVVSNSALQKYYPVTCTIAGDALADLKALQSGEPVGYYDPNQSKEELAFSFTYEGDGFVPVYTAPQPVIPDGYVLVPVDLLEKVLFNSCHLPEKYQDELEALISAGKENNNE